MTHTDNIKLVPLRTQDRELFISGNQEAFNYRALEEFGLQDNHFESDGQIISRETIEKSINSGEAFFITTVPEDKIVGGVVIRTEGKQGHLDLLFVSPHEHNKGIGYAAWCCVEKLHPEVKIWETITPYFEERNIYFYVNKCGFHIVEIFNDYDDSEASAMLRFEKRS